MVVRNKGYNRCYFAGYFEDHLSDGSRKDLVTPWRDVALCAN